MESSLWKERTRESAIKQKLRGISDYGILKNMNGENNYQEILQNVWQGVKYILCIIGFLYIFLNFIGETGTVNGSSMSPTLSNGEHLYVDKLSPKLQNYKRFDVVVFPYRFEYNSTYIKRIIGLPGETVQIKKGAVYINGEVLDDPYAFEKMKDSGIAAETITLGNDQYFVLGDNRNDSKDSRDNQVGVLNKSSFIGKPWFCYWPLKDFKFLNGSHIPFAGLCAISLLLIVLYYVPLEKYLRTMKGIDHRKNAGSTSTSSFTASQRAAFEMEVMGKYKIATRIYKQCLHENIPLSAKIKVYQRYRKCKQKSEHQ